MNFLSRLLKYLSKGKVHKQLYALYFSAVLIPILVIGLFLIINTYNLLLEHYISQVESDNLRVKSIMLDTTINFYNIAETISLDPALLSLLQTSFKNTKEAISSCSNYKKLEAFSHSNTSISTLTIYSENPTFVELDNFKLATPTIKQQPWYQKASSQPDGFWQSNMRTDSYNNQYWELTFYKRIPLIETNSQAILAIKVCNNYLKNRIQNNELFTIISVNQDPIFFSTNRQLFGTPLPVPIDYTLPYYHYTGQITYDEKPQIASISTLYPYNSKDKLYMVTIHLTALDHIKQLILTCTIIVLLSVFLPFTLITLFTKYFSKRIGILRSAMHQAALNDFNIIDSFSGDDELSHTFSDLKLMIQSIKEKNAQMYAATIHRQKLQNEQQNMEFKMLASQINPHFLYNTLETIRMKALTVGNRDIASAISLLGKSMHYVLENTGLSSTTLKKELDYIATYLSIQKLRFSDRVNYTFEVSEDVQLENYQILPLLLQPIVENAILHGLEGIEENGQIHIKMYTYLDELLIIDISDNGTGMDEIALKDLRAKLELPHYKTTSSIGLYNVHQRIKLYYGSEYGMTITSSIGEGTHISLKLPLYNIKGE